MKSFAVTLLLLVIMLLGIVTNALYINNVANEMLQMLDELPDPSHPSCGEKARALLEFWNAHLSPVELSVNYLIVDRVTEQARLLVSAAEEGDSYGYAAARTLLRDAVEDLERLESMALGSIL